MTSDATAFTRPTGFVDVGIATNYVIHPLLGSQLLASGDSKQSRAEPNRITIEGAEITIVEPNGAKVSIGNLPNPFSVIATGTIDPTASSDATYAVTQVEAIPPVFMEAYRKRLHDLGGIGTTQTIHAKVKVFGHTLGGTAIETGVFTYPITACYGCGVSVPADAVDPKISGRNCKNVNPAASSGTQLRTICYVGQDFITDCRACQGVVPLCTPCSTSADCSTITSPITKTAATCNTVAGFCE